jgi:Family of unknown function (DUF6325)
VSSPTPARAGFGAEAERTMETHLDLEPRRSDEAGYPTDAGSPPDFDLVEYLVMTTSGLSSMVAVAAALKELVESARIRILDMVGVETDAWGGYLTVEPELLSSLGQLHTVEGEVGGLLSEDDIAIACGALSSGTAALILVIEDRWAHPLADAVRSAGGHIAGGERIPRYRIERLERWSVQGSERVD